MCLSFLFDYSKLADFHIARGLILYGEEVKARSNRLLVACDQIPGVLASREDKICALRLGIDRIVGSANLTHILTLIGVRIVLDDVHQITGQREDADGAARGQVG